VTTTVFVAVILAAALHAAWNALVKGGADKELAMAAVVFGHVPPALLVLPFVPVPAAESLPYLAAGLALHTGYQVFLVYAYRVGDLTQVYPLARGSAPVLVAGVSVAVLGVALTSLELVAVAVIAAGIMSMSLVRRGDGQRNPRAAALALATGGFTAGYSLVDGMGARVSGMGFGYFAWLALGNAAVFALVLAVARPGLVARVPREGMRVFLVGGTASFVAYSLVVWGFTQAPIALVTALRETSIVFALLLGVYTLGERMDLAKVVSTMLTLFGAALLRLARP
jgi:drug/metabolite transporter (DMT)-like permease